MKRELFTGTGKLIAFIIRRDRLRIPIWIISLALITFATALSLTDLYATPADRQVIAETMNNPAMTAMIGQGYGIKNYTIGAMLAHQLLLFSAIAVAIMNILSVVRYTRADEEDGRLELIRSFPIGRLANINAGVIVSILTNIILAIIIGFGLVALKIESIDLNGSLIYGGALAATGIFFTALTAMLAQISQNTRNAIGLSLGSLILFYIIRALGDVSESIMAWFSPLGWVLSTEVFVNNYSLPLILSVSVSLIIIAFTYYLNSIRDLDAAFLSSKPGKNNASPLLLSPLGLAFRLQRTGLIAWAIGILIVGIMYGSILGDLESFFESIDIMEKMLPAVEGFSLTEQFVTLLTSVMAMISTVPVLMVILKLYSEEKKNQTELLLSRAVSRTQLILSYLIIAIFTAFVMLSLAMIGLWSTGLVVMDNPIHFSTFYGGGMAYLPAILIMIGITLLLIGLTPRLASLIWGYLIYSFIVLYLGGLLDFPDWMNTLSPFGYIPTVPTQEVNFLKMCLITLVGIIIIVIGFISYRKRDIQG